jgi:hypothetical protein
MKTTKKEKYGNYIGKVEYFDIRMKPRYEKKENKKTMESHSYRLYKGKILVASGMKSKEEAIQKAYELMKS